MKLFDSDVEAIFIERPNRFIIYARTGEEVVKCHCPNTGRMGELLFPGVKLILERSKNPARVTKFTVVAVYKGDLIVPITSVRANDVAREVVIPRLFDKPVINQEVTFGKSRFDFLVESDGIKTFIEVKSCTLFIDDVAKFPDAPTSRGVKHLKELKLSLDHGYRGMVIFVVFNPYSKQFTPNALTDPVFSDFLKRVDGEVEVVPFKVGVDSSGGVIMVDNPILPIYYN